MEKLAGKKTYLSAFAIAILSVAHYVGWVDESAYLTALGLFGAGGLASLRSGCGK